MNDSNITLKPAGCEGGQHGLVSLHELTFPDYLLEGNGRAMIRTKGHTSMQAEMYIGERVPFPEYGFDIKLVETHQGNNTCDSTATFTLYENDEMADKTIVHDFDAGREYNLTEDIREDGLHLEFDPAIPVCTDCKDIKNLSQASEWIMTENHRLSIMIGGKRWVLSGLEKDADSVYVALGDEESYTILSPHIDFGGCDTRTLGVGDEEFRFKDYSCMYGPCEAMMAKVGEEDSMLRIGTTAEGYNGKFLRVWTFAPGYTYCAKWIDVSSFFQLVDLAEPANNVTLTWENETTPNPALRSIFIPRSSPIFGKLIGYELEFSHPVPKTVFDGWDDGLLVEAGEDGQLERIRTELAGKEWVVTMLTDDALELGSEEDFRVLPETSKSVIQEGGPQCEQDVMQTANKTWYLEGHECGDPCEEIFRNLDDEREMFRMHTGETKFVDGRYVHLWKARTRGPFAYLAVVSVLSDTVRIDSSEAEFSWEDGDLVSVSIPPSSPIFDKLTAQSSN